MAESLSGLQRSRIHRALTRPNLLMGADRELVLLTGLAAVILIFVVLTVYSALFGIAVWVVILWLLRMMAKFDPLMRQVYMARIGFEYPGDISTKIADINARLETGGIAGTAPDKLTFSYSVSGGAPWKPRRVYSDGVKTYIQFPKSISGQDAPVLFVVSGGQNRIVNYRMDM